MKKMLNSIVGAIGETPCLRLQKIAAELQIEGNLIAKLDYLNPGFSKKDRIGLYMIEEAEKAGLLKPGQTVVELTSGNTGTGLAIVCAAKGYHFVACMSKGNSVERARMMRAFGAELVLVDQTPHSVPGQVSGEDLELVELAAQRVTQERGAFRADQFNLVGNTHAHEYGTARELLEQTDGKIDIYLDFLGSGGTFQGCARAMKDHNENILCYVVEPSDAAYFSGLPIENGNHKIQGGGYSRALPLVDLELIDGVVTVTDDESIEYTRMLARLEGAFCGFSSGANLCAAVKLLRGEHSGKNVAFLCADSGLKYLSTDLYE